ncbi:MAG: fuculose phosphate aldolase [Phycisphaerales bacterium]|nr:fuculose phosphate aldolase [Phycisphaerales bacterium]
MPTDLPNELLPQFQSAGESLLSCRCNNSHSGNLSVRRGQQIVITRTGAMLARLTADDLVVTSLSPTPDESTRASSETPAHLEIYRRTSAAAVAHGHALSAVAAGWLTDRLEPLDLEGAYYFNSIPVLEHVPATADASLGQALADLLKKSPVVILRGHGVFAVGDTLESAAQRITSVNDSAELFLRARALGLDTHALRNAPYIADVLRRKHSRKMEDSG